MFVLMLSFVSISIRPPVLAFMKVPSIIMPVSVPMTVTLPSPPVLLHLSVRDAFMHRAVAKTGGNRDYRTGHPITDDMTPWSIIVPGSVPVPMMRAIPVTVIKEYIHVLIRRIIHIGVWYHDKARRCRYHKWW
jgi:CO dehydrogenase/acetyl-CoA synthase delta subunit